MQRLLVNFAAGVALLLTEQAVALQLSARVTDEIADPDPYLTAAFQKGYPARGDVSAPRMLAMRGCSGSSAVMIFARALLRYHGIPVPGAFEAKMDQDGKPIPPPVLEGVQLWPAEMLKPSVNWFYEAAGGSMGKAMELANDRMHQLNHTLFFKGMVQEIAHDDEWADLKPSFLKMKMLAVLGGRQNMLDQVLCQIKDCFQEDYGYPVEMASGERSSLCFDRRDKTIVHGDKAQKLIQQRQRTSIFASALSTGDGYLAQVNISGLGRSINHEHTMLKRARDHLTGTIDNFKEVTEEDLLDFQTDIPGALQRGVNAWSNFMTSLGVTPDQAKIQEFLSHYANTYPRDAPHKELIYNWREVQEAIKGTEYEKYWRN